jgi:hypothetical protein
MVEKRKFTCHMMVMACTNWEASQRKRKARYLMRCIESLGISHGEVARALGVDARRIKRMYRCTPQLHVLHALGMFVQERAVQSQA